MSNKLDQEARGFHPMNGLDPNSRIYNPEGDFLKEIQQKRNQIEEEKVKKEALEELKKQQEELKLKLESLRLMPLHSNLMLEPYKSNPYKKLLSDSGIITSWDGGFLNTDSGEKDNLEELIKFGKVIEIGPLCKEVMVGDDVLYDTRSTRPIPFMNKGYYIIAESNALLIINDNIKERFNHVQ